MERFEVSPAELEDAAGTLGRVESSLGCPTRALGELGSPELEAAVGEAFEAADMVALAMADALAAAAAGVSANGRRYAGTEAAGASAFEDAARSLAPSGGR